MIKVSGLCLTMEPGNACFNLQLTILFRFTVQMRQDLRPCPWGEYLWLYCPGKISDNLELILRSKSNRDYRHRCRHWSRTNYFIRSNSILTASKTFEEKNGLRDWFRYQRSNSNPYYRGKSLIVENLVSDRSE